VQSCSTNYLPTSKVDKKLYKVIPTKLQEVGLTKLQEVGLTKLQEVGQVGTIIPCDHILIVHTT
jgi:hypothetical protein